MPKHKVFKITKSGRELFKLAGISEEILIKLDVSIVDREFIGEQEYLDNLKKTIGEKPTDSHQTLFLRFAFQKEITDKELSSIQKARSTHYSCFISYSRKDKEFAEKLYKDLIQKGIDCWFDLKDVQIGEEIRKKVKNAIKLYDKLLIIISKHSLESDWVFTEVLFAEQKEDKHNKPVWFPIKIDNKIMESDRQWAKIIKDTIHIGDFCDWRDSQKYERSFDELLTRLEKQNSTTRR